MERLEHIKKDILSEISGNAERALVEQIDIMDNNGSVIVSCPSIFSKKYICREYDKLFEKHILSAIQSPVNIEFLVNTKKRHRRETGSVQMSLPANTSTASKYLNPQFTFDEFVVGKSNAFAFEAAKALTMNDTTLYNPLFFYSDTGLGKSHISHAIANDLIKTRPRTKVQYTTARNFSYDFVHAARNNEMNRFKEVYHSSKTDIFFIDDVHMFKNKEKTQLELCAVLDNLISAGKQVVLSGFRPPNAIEQIDVGLRSRLSSGLVINIRKPGNKTRQNIIRHKARKNGIELHDDVVEFISDNIHSNVRDLESAVLTLTALGSLMKRDITLDLARETLEGLLEKKQTITIDYIQELVASSFGIKKEDMLSASRKRNIVYPRHVAIFLCRRYTGESLQIIAQAFSRKHPSIIHSIETMESKCSQDLKTKREIDFLIEKIDSQFS
ncbi:MAG: chromosomal replication initiator protein DnaA [Thermodesulfobacteriota bacterium]|nr:chromosomal replication initiator protein DnaA [Thermodesulfobacteriota bacterium]